MFLSHASLCFLILCTNGIMRYKEEARYNCYCFVSRSTWPPDKCRYSLAFTAREEPTLQPQTGFYCLRGFGLVWPLFRFHCVTSMLNSEVIFCESWFIGLDIINELLWTSYTLSHLSTSYKWRESELREWMNEFNSADWGNFPLNNKTNGTPNLSVRVSFDPSVEGQTFGSSHKQG